MFTSDSKQGLYSRLILTSDIVQSLDDTREILNLNPDTIFVIGVASFSRQYIGMLVSARCLLPGTIKKGTEPGK